MLRQLTSFGIDVSVVISSKLLSSGSAENSVEDCVTAQAVLDALNAHTSEPNVVDAAVRTLWQVSFRSAAVSETVLNHGLGTVTAAMAAHPAVPSIQESGCGVIWVASHICTEPQQARAVAAVMVPVRAAMRRFPREVGIQESGCAAIGNLALDQAMRPSLQPDKNFVLKAMRLHSTDKNVQETCAKALFNLNIGEAVPRARP